MDDYIKREDALFALCSTVHFGEEVPCRNQIVSCQWNATRVQDYAESILSIPPADVAPVKHGEWLWELADNGWADHICSLCGWTENTDIHVSISYSYCPHCGAQMDG